MFFGTNKEDAAVNIDDLKQPLQPLIDLQQPLFNPKLMSHNNQ